MFDVVDRPELIEDDVIADFEDCADAYDVIEAMKEFDQNHLDDMFIQGNTYKDAVEWFVKNNREFRSKFEEELIESVKRCEP